MGGNFSSRGAVFTSCWLLMKPLGAPHGSPNSDPIADQYMPFSDLGSKIHIHFQTWCGLLQYSPLESRSEELVTFNLNDVFWLFLFLYHSFGVEKTKTLCACGSLENLTRFQTRNGQNLYPFYRPKGWRTIPFGASCFWFYIVKTHLCSKFSTSTSHPSLFPYDVVTIICKNLQTTYEESLTDADTRSV